MSDDLLYSPPSTLRRFMRSDAYGRIAAGPVGSGKTTACLMELLRRACEQRPASDGNRYTRFAVIRQTLKSLKDTVLKDCETWLSSRGFGIWKVADSTFIVNFDDVRSEWVFLPLEDAQDQARLLSMQLTGAWLSECIEMDLNILGPVTGRVGRYPSGARGQPTWTGIIADTNMPTEMTPWQVFMQNAPSEWDIFIQPSGLSKEAENLEWLTQSDETIKLPTTHPVRIAQGRKYYERLVAMHGADSDWVRRYVYAEYGDDPSGAAVFKNTFKASFHVVDDTQIIPGYPLLIGQDFGRNPWSLICQPDHMGRLLVHEEVPGVNVGLEKHVQESLKPRLFSDRYTGTRVAAVGDPSGVAKGNVAEESCFDALKRLQIPAFPAPTNSIDARLRAVEALLGRQVGGGPALMISRARCPKLVRALSGGYRFVKRQQGGLSPTPDKNGSEGYDHVADCLQYAALVVHGGLMPIIAERIKPFVPRPQRQVSPLGWT
jgi:hypothetical protein